MTSIVRIQELELNALEELRAESSREGFRFVERLCDEWVSGANRFNAPGEALFVAVADGQVVGVCGLNCDPYACDPHVGRVRRFYVARAYRRRGIGRALLESVITSARDHFSLLRARTDASSDFYIARGFRRITSEPEATHVLALTSHDGPTCDSRLDSVAVVGLVPTVALRGRPRGRLPGRGGLAPLRRAGCCFAKNGFSRTPRFWEPSSCAFGSGWTRISLAGSTPQAVPAPSMSPASPSSASVQITLPRSAPNANACRPFSSTMRRPRQSRCFLSNHPERVKAEGLSRGRQ